MCKYSFGFVTHNVRRILLENNRPLTHSQKKKALKDLAALTSILGNINAHFPKIRLDFLTSIGKHYPELSLLAVEEANKCFPDSLSVNFR
jgi:hypothetical protein